MLFSCLATNHLHQDLTMLFTSSFGDGVDEIIKLFNIIMGCMGYPNLVGIHDVRLELQPNLVQVDVVLHLV